jgi:probable HAF family extracellular repeat protein
MRTVTALAIALSWSFTAAAWSPPGVALYGIVEIPTIDGGNISSTAVNNHGDVVGSFVATNTFLPFLYQHETGVINMLDLPAPELGSPGFGLAFGIDDNRVVVGQTDTRMGNRAIMWFTNGGFELLPVPTTPFFLTAANAVNNRGRAVGVVEGSFPNQAVLWRVPEQTLTPLPGLPCQGCTGPGDRANAINHRGDVVGSSEYSIVSNGLVTASGQHAVEWSDGNINDLGALNGSNSSEATGINDAEEIVGESAISSDSGAPTHAFLYRRGQMQDLGTLEGDVSSSATGIDNRAEVVGVSTTAANDQGAITTRPFIYLNGHMLDLNSVLDSTSPLADFVTLQAATAISSNGEWIAANGFDNRGGPPKAYLLMRLH